MSARPPCICSHAFAAHKGDEGWEQCMLGNVPGTDDYCGCMYYQPSSKQWGDDCPTCDGSGFSAPNRQFRCATCAGSGKWVSKGNGDKPKGVIPHDQLT